MAGSASSCLPTHLRNHFYLRRIICTYSAAEPGESIFRAEFGFLFGGTGRPLLLYGCVYACVFLACVSWIVCWEEVSCHSIHAATVKARAADSEGGPPIWPFLCLLHVVQRYLSRKLLWMPAWCHILSFRIMAFSAYLPTVLKSLSPWQPTYPPPFWLSSSSHILEFPPAVRSGERGSYMVTMFAACNQNSRVIEQSQVLVMLE